MHYSPFGGSSGLQIAISTHPKALGPQESTQRLTRSLLLYITNLLGFLGRSPLLKLPDVAGVFSGSRVT